MFDLVSELAVAVLSLGFVAQCLRTAVPYALASVAGTFSERSGVINIALEGKLLVGAFCAIVGAYYSGSIVVGVLGGVAGGVALAALYGWVVIRCRGNQVVAGVAINFLAFGTTAYGLKLIFGSASGSAQTVVMRASLVGNWVWWLVVVVLCVSGVVFYRTAFGLRLRASGDAPDAVTHAGVSVTQVRWQAVLLCGVLCGLAGAWLSLGIGRFSANLSGGRGFAAIACMIIGGWSPIRAIIAALVFGVFEALSSRLQTLGFDVPVEILDALPLIVAVIAVASFVGRSRAPAALGKLHRSQS